MHPIYQLGAAPLQFGDIPWPDDGYLDARGRIALADLPSAAEPSYRAALVQALGDLDGFGLRPTIYLRFDDEIDPMSLPQTSDATLTTRASVFLIDADPSSPEAFQQIAVEVNYRAGQNELRLRPAGYRALTPGRRYAVVITDGVKGTEGQPIAGAPQFVRVRDTDTVLEDARERAARALYAPVLATLAKQRVKREHVAALAVFHVQSAGSDLADARALVRAQMQVPPVFSDVVSGARLDAVLGDPPADAKGLDQGGPHGHIGWMIHGRFSTPNLLFQQAGVHGAFEREMTGELRVKGSSDVFFTLFLPRNDALDRAYPVAIVQHGWGGDRSDALPLANALASSGYAVIALDAPFHGLSGGQADTHNRFTGADTPDGFGDAPGDFAGQADEAGDLIAFHPYYYRDAMRQGVVNLAALVYLLENIDNWGLGTLNASLAAVKLNTARVSVVGIDFGGEMGAMLATLEPSVAALVAAFSSGLTLDAWAESPGKKDLVEGLIVRLGRDPRTLAWDRDSPLLWPDFDAWRTLTDRASPVAIAPALRRAPVNILTLMARDDEVVHNLGTESFAEAVGAEFVGGSAGYVTGLPSTELQPGATLRANFPPGAGTVTRALYRLDPATHATLSWANDSQHYQTPFAPPFTPLKTPNPVTNPLGDTLTQIRFLLESMRSCPAASAGVLPVCAASVQAQNPTHPVVD